MQYNCLFYTPPKNTGRLRKFQFDPSLLWEIGGFFLLKTVLFHSFICKKLSGWILRAFRTRGAFPLLCLFKALVLCRLEYGCQLWNHHFKKDIHLLEDIQRGFTWHIVKVSLLSYSERLSALNHYSVQRRSKRYLIIYVWKILEGIVPNLRGTTAVDF